MTVHHKKKSVWVRVAHDKKKDGVRVHDWVRVDHEKKSAGVRGNHEKKSE